MTYCSMLLYYDMLYCTIMHPRASRPGAGQVLEREPRRARDPQAPHGRFPKFHRVLLGRDPGTLKSDIVSKRHPQ